MKHLALSTLMRKFCVLPVDKSDRTLACGKLNDLSPAYAQAMNTLKALKNLQVIEKTLKTDFIHGSSATNNNNKVYINEFAYRT